MGPLEPHQSVAVAVAAVTLAGVAFGRLPFVPLDRAGFALVGAASLLATGVLDLGEAIALIDAEVLVLLFGLMLLNEALAEAGAFRALLRWATRRAGHPLALLATLTLAAGGPIGALPQRHDRAHADAVGGPAHPAPRGRSRSPTCSPWRPPPTSAASRP
jgi:hypothetical protein